MSSNRHLIACLLLGCTSSSETPPADGGEASQDAVGDGGSGGSTATGEDPQPPGAPPAIALPRGLGHDGSITEVWLDPRASAALSLDSTGGVRLWPALPTASEDLAALAPIRVPLREPTSLSFARAGASSFVIAAIDTVQMGQVLSVDLDEDGTPRMRERFTIPLTDPLLELHVFDGGERVLALGVDHRLTLYDADGNRLSELAEYGLAPWQLRIAGTPEAPQLAMILVGPTRIQRLSIAGDKLAVVGEARPFVLDRGPNLNDLALMPSGKTAAMFRRPKGRGLQWSLELVDLDSGEVRVMWGEAESKFRPRMYIVDDKRALLEDGSGAGFWVDLAGGAIMPTPFELPEELEKLPPETRVTPTRVDLPVSSMTGRRQVAVLGGLRAVPDGAQLIFDPLDADHHFRLAQPRLSLRRSALDPTGEQLAFVTPDKQLTIMSLGDHSRHPVAGCTSDADTRLAFTDADHVLLIETETAKICEWRSGKIVSEVALPEFEMHELRPGDPGAGEIGFAVTNDEGNAVTSGSRLSFASNAFAAVEPLTKADIKRDWPDIDVDGKTLAIDRAGRRYTTRKLDTREFDITTPEGEQRTLQISDSKINIERFDLAPDAKHVAIVHEAAVNRRYHYYYDYYDQPSTLSMWAIDGERPELLWSVPDEAYMQLSWSADGSRIAYSDRVLTPKGELISEAPRRELELERLPDVPAPKP